MKHCSSCKLDIITENEKCPLCQGTVEKINDDEKIFPTIKKKNKKYIVIKILLIISLLGVISSGTVNLSLPSTNYWSAYVLFGVGCFWILATVFLIKRKNILKTIIYETVILMIMAVAWDYTMGGKNWSINFVVPILGFICMLLTLILIKALRLKPEDYSIYLFDIAIISIVPIIFYLKGIVTIKIPTLISGASNITLIMVFIIFEGEKIITDLRRRFHL